MKELKINELIKKKLPETFFVVYAIKNEINIIKNDIVENVDLYTLIGIDSKGIRHLLNIYIDRINNNHFWLDCFEALKVRGIKNILFLSVGDNKNIKRTAKVAFPNIIFIDSLTDIYPRFYKFISEKSNTSIASKINALYIQKTTNEYKEKLRIFKERYNNVIHQKLIEKYFVNIENTYKYSHNIRNLLFKHTANIAFYDKIRIKFNKNSYIDSLEDIYKELDNNLNDYFGFTSFKKGEWTLILNDLIQIYPDMELI